MNNYFLQDLAKTFNQIYYTSIVPALRAGIIHNDTLPLVPVAAYNS